MKNWSIIRKAAAGLLIVAFAACTFGCSKTSSASKDLGNAFSAAAEENGLEELDWGNTFSNNTFHTGFSSTTTHGDDADEMFVVQVVTMFNGTMFGTPKINGMLARPEIREMSGFYLCDSAERIHGFYIIFENEEDCEAYRDLFFEWFGDEIGEEMGFECFANRTEDRMNGLYRDGKTLIWLTGYLYDTPVALPFIYEKLGLSYPELSED